MIGRLTPTTVWHAWLTFTAGSFALLEARALAMEGESATLTAHLRRTLGVHPRRPLCWAGQLLIAVVMGWVAGHLCLGRWPSERWFDSRWGVQARTVRTGRRDAS